VVVNVFGDSAVILGINFAWALFIASLIQMGLCARNNFLYNRVCSFVWLNRNYGNFMSNASDILFCVVDKHEPVSNFII
jgi:hypothetical protein